MHILFHAPQAHDLLAKLAAVIATWTLSLKAHPLHCDESFDWARAVNYC